MRQFGLIGFPLTHSFSKKYFTEKFQNENIVDANYELFEIEDISTFSEKVNNIEDLKGLNVTIPHKQAVMPFLQSFDSSAELVGAVNVIKKLEDGTLKGFNSDYYGFMESLKRFLGDVKPQNALVLGTGGAAKAVFAALNTLQIPFQVVSRNASDSTISYQDVTEELVKKSQLIINTTPLGMYPKVDTCPDLPYNAIGENHFLFDLVYNPAETLFLQKGANNGAKTQFGLEMLHLQAEKAWEIWNQ
ncbi:MAG: hypothetical protein RLZZ175_479 [Bacteroidota bacterium]|jgi:shikimate dehydrogenase